MHFLAELTQVLLLQVLEEALPFCATEIFYPVPCLIAMKAPARMQKAAIRAPGQPTAHLAQIALRQWKMRLGIC